jgi:trehalose 6-phosphate synthase
MRLVYPPSGLITVLAPIARACADVWVATSLSASDEAAAQAEGVTQPCAHEHRLRLVPLTSHEHRAYYQGLSTEGLWPLCHRASVKPRFDHRQWEVYQTVNRRFADAICEEAISDDPLVFLHDFHVALVPQLLRERLPNATIVAFWHIPWPELQRFEMFPWNDVFLRGLLGADVVGFQTRRNANNFVDACNHFLGSKFDRRNDTVSIADRVTEVRQFPASIEWPSPPEEDPFTGGQSRASVLAELCLHAETRIGLGIDRLCYTKGLEERFLAVERLLDRHVHLRGQFTFVQLASPTREEIAAYRLLGEQVDTIVARINEKYGQRQPAAVLLRGNHGPPRVAEFLRAADVAYVSSLHDGMNLVAKEYARARADELGVLVLSQFTGAAVELTSALIVNPYDIESASDALAKALAMSTSEQRTRMRDLRRVVRSYDVYHWAVEILEHAALRRAKC